MSAKTITVNLRVWRQPAKDQPGRLVDYVAKDISTDMSFLEMLDVVNEDLIRKGEDAIAFDSDCREGICGACGCMINGVAHGPDPGTTTCQLHMRRFSDGQTIVIEPWKAKAFPILKDLTVDRSSFDRIIQAGGFITARAGSALDALHRNESCGGHFREEFQTPEGEALRDDEHYSYVAAWEFTGVGSEPKVHKEPLVFDEVHPSQRSYK